MGRSVRASIAAGQVLLRINLSPYVQLCGLLTNVSSEDIEDNFREFNKQATFRLMIGFPASIRNGAAITFTLNAICLTLNSKMLDVALADYHLFVWELPETILRGQIGGTFETDTMFRELLEQNVALKSTNQKLLATRKWLSTVDIYYRGGSLTGSMEDGRITVPGENNKRWVTVPLSCPDTCTDSENHMSCPFNTLSGLRVTLGGIDILEHLGGPRITNDAAPDGRMFISFGSVVVVGWIRSRGLENVQWPRNNMYYSLQDSLAGEVDLPDEVEFIVLYLALRGDNERVARTVEMLGLSLSDDDEQESPSESGQTT